MSFSIICRVALLVAAVPLTAGCPGPSDPPQHLDGPGLQEAGVVFPDTGTTLRPDGFRPDAPVGPCDEYASSGQSCAGGQACPPGLQAATIGAEPCRCYVPCDPDAQAFCHPIECNRICVQLVDSQQQPLPGAGACVADPGAEEGEPCVPVCKQGLFCVAASAEAAFCRRGCAVPQDCVGFKIVCAPLSAPSQNVCIPGGSTTGPVAGEPCGGPEIFCQQDLFCDPQSKICVPVCDPNNSSCPAGTSCTQLLDTQANVVIGYGCK